jgi:hypothetical protein
MPAEVLKYLVKIIFIYPNCIHLLKPALSSFDHFSVYELPQVGLPYPVDGVLLSFEKGASICIL